MLAFSLHRTLLLLLLVCCLSLAKGQALIGERAGLRMGVTLNWGTHHRHLGIFFNAFWLPGEGPFQLNAALRAGFASRGYGPMHKARNELRLSVGALLGFGEQEVGEEPSPFLSPVSNQTGHPHGVAYAYNFYVDDIGTSQRTATIGLDMGPFFLVTENDAFADPILDRFRTGTLQLGWEDGPWRLAVNSLLWTGDPASRGRRNLKSKNYPARYGIVDLSDATYGRFSHGILSGQVQYHAAVNSLLGGQVLRLEVGKDDEKVRHALQNRLIHDAFFLPKKWNKVQNRHVPMLDNNGFPYLFREDQMLRKSRWYGQLALNPALFW
jgi:hypothetical protein